MTTAGVARHEPPWPDEGTGHANARRPRPAARRGVTDVRRSRAERNAHPGAMPGRRHDRPSDPLAAEPRPLDRPPPWRLSHGAGSGRLAHRRPRRSAGGRRLGVVAPDGRVRSRPQRGPAEGDRRGHRRATPDPAATWVVLHRRAEADDAVDPLHWPWRTTVEETVLDVSAVGSVDEMFAILGRAFQRRLTTEQAVLARLAARTRHRRRELLQLVLADAADGAKSAMEVRFVRDVLRPHGLPIGVRQRSTSPDRRELHDVGFPEQRVLVELDGRLGHEGREARVQDGRRDRRSAAGGWLTVRAFWPDVAVTPCELAVEVAAILGSRGWRDPGRTCRRQGCAFRLGSPGGATSAR